MGILFLILFYALIVPGTPFAMLLSKFKQMGDGTGNETRHIDFVIWSAILGVVAWTLVIAGGIWAWNSISISISSK